MDDCFCCSGRGVRAQKRQSEAFALERTLAQQKLTKAARSATPLSNKSSFFVFRFKWNNVFVFFVSVVPSKSLLQSSLFHDDGQTSDLTIIDVFYFTLILFLKIVLK